MLTKLILLFIISINLHAKNALNDVYYVDTNEIKLSNIIKTADQNITLFHIYQGRHTKKVKSKDLIKILNQHGYSDFRAKHKYINFIKKSPIDTTKIKNKIKEYYEKNYTQIDIKNIIVEPRSYTDTLPKNYTVQIRSRNYLSRKGTLSIKTLQRRRIFFNYIIDASVDIYVTRKKIKKKTELSALNTSKKSIILDKFRAKPIQIINTSSLQSKHHISKNKILTSRDVESLSVVKRNSYISVSLKLNNVDISFSAKALEDGRVNEIINVMKQDGKRLKVKVISKNKAEMR